MRASRRHSRETDVPTGVEFGELEADINARFFDAIAANGQDERYRYIMLDSGTPYRLGIFCLANTIEPLGFSHVEQLRMGVPIAEADDVMPQSVLGAKEDAHYFYLKFMARRGGPKELRVDPDVYAKRFLSKGQHPVNDLAQKLKDYQPIPLRKRCMDNDLTVQRGLGYYEL
jgi:hypothetical protein